VPFRNRAERRDCKAPRLRNDRTSAVNGAGAERAGVHLAFTVGCQGERMSPWSVLALLAAQQPPIAVSNSPPPAIVSVPVAPPPILVPYPVASPAPMPPRPVIVAGPEPRKPMQELIGPDDYPASALAQRAEGWVDFTLEVGANGRVTGCTITFSSGSSALDSATCRILRSRARFTPARDSNGMPVAAPYDDELGWKLPS